MDLDKRMKLYEQADNKRILPYSRVMIRLDGKGFHNFCKQMGRPFDMKLIKSMRDLTVFLMKESGAKIGYTQSDEISLLLYSDTFESSIYFDGKTQKILSILAAKASVFFNKIYTDGDPVFDCRIWTIPDEEIANYFVWREQDAIRNSIQMAGQAKFSHKQLHKKSCNDIQDMLHEKGINWNDYPPECKRGSYFKKFQEDIAFSADEIEKLPKNHEARSNPDLVVTRGVIREISSKIGKYVANSI